eukprot:scaffold170399_cov28-Tisochrysis_lutea.AAC.4
MVLTVCVTAPRPPQVAHVVTDAPGATPEPPHVVHASSWVIRIFFSPPKRAWRRGGRCETCVHGVQTSSTSA